MSRKPYRKSIAFYLMSIVHKYISVFRAGLN